MKNRHGTGALPTTCCFLPVGGSGDQMQMLAFFCLKTCGLQPKGKRCVSMSTIESSWDLSEQLMLSWSHTRFTAAWRHKTTRLGHDECHDTNSPLRSYTSSTCWSVARRWSPWDPGLEPYKKSGDHLANPSRPPASAREGGQRGSPTCCPGGLVCFSRSLLSH